MSATKAAQRQVNNNLRTTTSTNPGSITPNADTTEFFAVLSLNRALTVNAPSGSPVDGQPLSIRIMDNGNTESISWDGIYQPLGDFALPETTGGGMVFVSMRYNAPNVTWDVLRVNSN